MKYFIVFISAMFVGAYGGAWIVNQKRNSDYENFMSYKEMDLRVSLHLVEDLEKGGADLFFKRFKCNTIVDYLEFESLLGEGKENPLQSDFAIAFGVSSIDSKGYRDMCLR